MFPKVPILIISFNRIDFTNRRLKELLDCDRRVYFWSDGPRNSSDSQHINIIRKMVNDYESRINFKEIYFSPSNLGMKNSILKAISWVFEFEESAIILEDDIIFTEESLDFFDYFLNKYVQHKSISGVSGINLVPENCVSTRNDLARLSIYTNSWGWATWKDRWHRFLGFDISQFSIAEHLPLDVSTYFGRRKWLSIKSSLSDGSLDSWAYLWQFYSWFYKLNTIYPNRSVTENEGFTADATNTSQRPNWITSGERQLSRTAYVDFEIKLDKSADRWTSRFVHPIGRIYWIKTIVRKLLKL